MSTMCRPSANRIQRSGSRRRSAEPRLAREPRVLLVVAHPDDESVCAATIYRITRELGGTVDQLVITNGEAGFRYSRLGEIFYGLPLTDEQAGRRRLPAIRKEEVRRAGRILGIRHQIFLDQTDGGFTRDGTEALGGMWDVEHVRRSIGETIAAHRYEYVFLLLPTRETHGHHQSAALLTLEAIRTLPVEDRPVVLGTEASEAAGLRPEVLSGMAFRPEAYCIDRSRPLPGDPELRYGIIVHWVAAEHKSQGLLQSEAARHSRENFWVLESGVGDAAVRAARLFDSLTPDGAPAVG